MTELNPENRTISGTAVKTLLEGNRISSRPVLLQTLQENFGFNYHNPPLLFPYESYLKLIEYVRENIYRSKSIEDGYFEMGYRLTEAHFNGPVGQVVKIAAGVLGPQRGARQFVKSMQSSLPWGVHDLEDVRPNYIRYRLRGVPGPAALLRGMIKASLEAGGAKDIRVNSTELSPENFVYTAEWN